MQTNQRIKLALKLGFAFHHHEAIPLVTAAKLAAYAGCNPCNNTACGPDRANATPILQLEQALLKLLWYS